MHTFIQPLSHSSGLSHATDDRRRAIILGARDATALYFAAQDTRHSAWNLSNLRFGIEEPDFGNGRTVEWRQPPGVTTAEECCKWAELAVAFVQAAMRPDTAAVLKSGEYSDNFAGLKRFVVERGQVVGRDQKYLDMAFDVKE